MSFLFKKNIKRLRAYIHVLGSGGKPLCHGGIRLLLYHSIGGNPYDHKLAVRVPLKKFHEELEFLRKSGYKTCTVSELIEHNLWQEREKYIALTFDDGYKDNLATAAPIIKKMGMNATFFITTSDIDGAGRKKWSNGSPREYMNWQDIRHLGEMGFEIGSHMIHHVDLTSIDDIQLRLELEGSRDIISKNTGKQVKVLSYPYGRLNQRIAALAREAGYVGGCSSVCGVNYAGTDRYILKRTEIDGYDTITDFRHKISGYYD